MKANQPNIAELLSIMEQLRHPETGCPWDRAQTFSSLAPYTLEETWELLDAIGRECPTSLKDELGDLLFQIIFYARISEEQQAFNFADICSGLAIKLKRRHPQIFGNEAISSKDLGQERSLIKAQERVERGNLSLLGDIPQHFPALLRAEKIQQRCQQVGFDWNELPPVVAKIEEELAEVMDELKKPRLDENKLLEEVGDLLFATVNLSRHLGCQAELALARANDKFIRRFTQVEQHLQAAGINLQEATLDEMEQAWQWVKARESTP